MNIDAFFSTLDSYFEKMRLTRLTLSWYLRWHKRKRRKIMRPIFPSVMR